MVSFTGPVQASPVQEKDTDLLRSFIKRKGKDHHFPSTKQLCHNLDILIVTPTGQLSKNKKTVLEMSCFRLRSSSSKNNIFYVFQYLRHTLLIFIPSQMKIKSTLHLRRFVFILTNQKVTVVLFTNFVKLSLVKLYFANKTHSIKMQVVFRIDIFLTANQSLSVQQCPITLDSKMLYCWGKFPLPI